MITCNVLDELKSVAEAVNFKKNTFSTERAKSKETMLLNLRSTT